MRVIFISGCIADTPFDFETDRLADIPIMDLPKRWYAPEEGRDAGYYVSLPGRPGAVYNQDIMIDFIDKVENDLEAFVRKVDYVRRHYDGTLRSTGEPEPVFIDFYYNGQYYYVTVDTTRDMGLPDEERNITGYRYNNLVKFYDEENERIHYFITDFSEVTNELWAEYYEKHDIIYLTSIKIEE